MTQVGTAEFQFKIDDSDLDRSLGLISRNVKTQGEKSEKILEKHLRSGGRAGGGAFQKEMTKSTTATASKMRSLLNKVGDGLGVGIATQLTSTIQGAVVSVGRSVQQFFGDSVAMAGDYNRAMGGIRQTIEQTGGAAQRSAEQLDEQARALGRSTLSNRQEVLKMQQALLTFKSVSGDVFDDAVGLSLDLAAAMGTDAKGAAIQLGKALENPAQGVSALTRSGVTFSDQQKKQIKDLQEQNKLYEAQQIVLKAIKGQLGGVAEAQATGTAGALDTLNEEINDLKILIGQAISPAVTALFSQLSNVVSGLVAGFSALTPEAQKAIGVTAAVATGLTALGVVVTGVSLAISAGLVASLAAAAAAAAPFVAAGAAIAGAIALVSAGIAKAINWWDGLSDAQKQATRENKPIQAAIGATIDAVRALGEWIGKNIPVWLDWAQTVVGAAVEVAKAIGSAISTVVEWLNAGIVLVINWRDTVGEMANTVSGFFSSMAADIVSTVQAFTGAVTQLFSSMADRAIAFIRGWIDFAVSALNRFIDAIPGLRQALDLFNESNKRVFGYAIEIIGKTANAVKDFSSGAVGYFKNVISAVNPLKKVLGDVWDLAKKAADGIKGLLGADKKGAGGFASIQEMKAFLQGGVPATNPGGYDLWSTTDGGASRQITRYDQSLPHHTYQTGFNGEVRDYTLEAAGTGNSRVPVPSALAGRVTAAGYHNGLGNYVTVESLNGLRATIGHLESIAVKVGQQVQFAQSIGIQGSTGRSSGPHVHIDAAAEVIKRWVDHITGASRLQSSTGLTRDNAIASVGIQGIGGSQENPDKDKANDASLKKIREEMKISSELKEIEEGNLDALQAKIGLIRQEIGLQEQKIANDQALGLITDLQAEEQRLVIREDGLQKLQQEIKLIEYLKSITKQDAVKVGAGQLSEGIRSFMADIEAIKAGIKEIRFEGFVEQYQLAQNEIQVATQKLQNDIALGLVTESEGVSQLLEKRRAIAATLAETIPLLQQYMATAADPSAVLNAQDLYERIRAISAETANQKAQIEETEKASTALGKLEASLNGLGGSALTGIIDVITNKSKSLLDFLGDISKQILQIGLRFLLTSAFGGAGGGFLGGIFKYGGTVGNYANGGTVLQGISDALQREGPNSVLAALTPGEEVLSLQNGDAQAFRALKSAGAWNAIKQTQNFRMGGTVGNGATVTRKANTSTNGLTVTRIDKMGDFVSFDQVMEMFSIRDPQVAMAGAQIVERNFQSVNYRKRNQI